MIELHIFMKHSTHHGVILALKTTVKQSIQLPHSYIHSPELKKNIREFQGLYTLYSYRERYIQSLYSTLR